MSLRSFVDSVLTNKKHSDPEFAVCWDLGLVESSLLIDSRAKTAHYLNYSRSAIHFTCYINKINFSEKPSFDDFLSLTSLLFESFIYMAKISGLSPKEIRLKNFFEAVTISPFLKDFEKTSLHDLTIFIWHNIIEGEGSISWFSTAGENKCDWQSVRSNVVTSFCLLTCLCNKIGIDFETLCSHFVKRHKDTKGENDG